MLLQRDCDKQNMGVYGVVYGTGLERPRRGEERRGEVRCALVQCPSVPPSCDVTVPAQAVRSPAADSPVNNSGPWNLRHVVRSGELRGCLCEVP